MPPAATIVLAVVTVVAAACSSEPSTAREATTSQPSGAAALHGVYRADYAGDEQVWNGKPRPDEMSARQYTIRSECTGDTCVATGVRLRDDDATHVFTEDDGKDVEPLTIDLVGDQWRWAERYEYRCDADGSTGHEFVAWSVTPQSDGKLTGTRVDARFASPACTGVFEVPITLSRVKDSDAEVSLPDPAAQPAWTHTAPAALTGNYNITNTPRQPGDQSPTLPAKFTSFCVRNTDTCIALERFTGSSGTESVNALEFADGRWTMTYLGGEVTCPLGGKAARTTYLEFVLPNPVTIPIDAMTGLQRSTFGGDCTDVNEWDLVAKRVRD
ncbi:MULTISPECIES: hypothetical protein [unclassified Mycobacterium]|uniref:hypothetical protein n=1 Tax=unclassified Mycobacterium TaxID=2642494 RepID=UPI0029C8FC75|nr:MULTISPECIES: hypothetical protein [unclassified Mycobacterium]